MNAVFSSKIWRKGQNRFCLEAKGVGEEVGGRGRNDPTMFVHE
jgi:hypothetical protein